MPAKSELMQPVLRETQRADFARRGTGVAGARPVPRTRGVGGNGALHSARGSNCENTKPNMESGVMFKSRRSPRLGACSAAVNNRMGGGALADITNVVLTDKAKPKPNVTAPVPETSAEAAVVENTSAGVNVQSCEEYADDILNQLFRDEAALLPQPDYMDRQTDISGKMRTILIDWLVEVHMKYRLRPETLHLTVNLIDRYLTRMPVMRKRLQLVGVVAMFIASKYEEIRPPELHDWVYITDNAYKKEDVLNMECNMLTTLSFQLMVPTAAHFFDCLQRANGCDAVHSDTAQYLLELGLLDLRMLQHTPSRTAAAALLLSNELLKRSPVWPASMVQLSRHTEQALRGCVDDLRQLHEADCAGAGGQLQAVHKKFSLTQHHAVTKMKFREAR